MTPNFRQTALTWIAKANPVPVAQNYVNFPRKQTVTSEKLHSPKVTEHGRG